MVSEVTSKKMWSSNLLRVGCSTRWWLMTHLTLWWQTSNNDYFVDDEASKKVDILQEWDVRMVQIIIMILQEISSLQNGTVGLSGGQAVVFLMKILWAFVQHIFNWLELSTDGQRSSCHKQSKVNTTKEMSKLFPFSVFGLLSLALLVAPWPSWPSMSGKEGRLGTCAWWTNV